MPHRKVRMLGVEHTTFLLRGDSVVSAAAQIVLIVRGKGQRSKEQKVSSAFLAFNWSVCHNTIVNEVRVKTSRG